jgi:MFS family permease
MIAACTVMVGAGFGVITNIAVFLMPLAVEFGWARADMSLAYSVATIAAGAGGIVMGHFADRMPVRPIALCGAIGPAVALLLLSRMTNIAQLYAWHLLLGLFGIAALMAPLNSLASAWSPRNPGLAIGIVSAGGALGQGLGPFIARHLVLVDGWRHAYVTLGLGYAAVMIPLALLLRDAPRAVAAVAAHERRHTLSPTWLLGWLCVAAMFCCVCMATPIMHVAALGSDRGLGPTESAGLLTTMMVCGMFGRIGFGRIADRFGNLPAYMLASAGQTALAFLFPLMPGRASLFVLSAVFGVCYSGAMTAFILCAREFSPPGRTALAIGCVMFFAWVGMAVGSWQGGLFFDLCGTYNTSFGNASLGGIANLAVLALMSWRIHRSTRGRMAAAAC